MFTNITLHSLFSFTDKAPKSESYNSLIEHYEEFYNEQDDEEINLELLALTTKSIVTKKEVEI